MRFDIMTLFPALINTVLGESIIGRAVRDGFLQLNTYDIRDYSEDRHRRVDDTPYGGGMGMLMCAPPIYRCFRAVTDERFNTCVKRRVIYMSPRGKVFNQEKAKELSENYDNIVILCGHYEGVDERIIEEIVDEEISIGDFVLTGGEIPACILVDAVARRIDGVLASPECYESESLSDGLVEYPQYTRPYDFMGRTVPDVLISGHHANIEKWRHEKSLELTERLRPDLLIKKEKKG